jgi:hypothetical protein
MATDGHKTAEGDAIGCAGKNIQGVGKNFLLMVPVIQFIIKS